MYSVFAFESLHNVLIRLSQVDWHQDSEQNLTVRTVRQRRVKG